MNEQDIYTDLFDQYTQGKLKEPERVAFEKRLFSDKDFGDAYRIYSSLVDGIREHGRLELKNYLKQHGKMKQPGKLRFMRPSYLAAASVILLLGIGGVIYFYTRPQYAPEMASQEIHTDFKDVPLGDSMRMVPEYVQRAGRNRPDMTEENEQEMIRSESPEEEMDFVDVSAGTISPGKYAEKSQNIAPDPPMAADDIYPVLSEKRLKDTVISAPVLIVFLDDREKQSTKMEDVAIMKKDSKSVEWKSSSKQKSSQNPGALNNNMNNNAGYANRVDTFTADKKVVLAEKPDLSKKQLQVEFWKSPVNFRGYSYIGNKILLYSVSQTSARIFVVNEKTYLRTEGIVYLLEPCSNTCDFKSETNTTIINFILQQP